MKNVPAGKTTRSLWITLEATEIIELKRIKQDYDEEGALTFFRQVVAPRVRAAALQRGLALDLLTEEAADERISR
jgi:hypothetical protein